mgnify:FL=1
MNVMRIAMWSGPRNISSALMRSFENRSDTWVCDEPFYGFYLKISGAPHPDRQEIIDSMVCDPESVIETLTKEVNDSLSINYQKHMTHHFLPEISGDWLFSLKNCFLIRDPLRVISSYAKVRSKFSFEELGMQQQLDLFHLCANELGEAPPVIDAERCLVNPKNVLTKLCQRLNISFSSKMLEWPIGSRASDGLWAKHWYSDLYKTTHFSLNQNNYKSDERKIEKEYSETLKKALEIYNELSEYAL